MTNINITQVQLDNVVTAINNRAKTADVSSGLATKVAKVTSTDNAIVRFDGTTGAVQNSGVIINDNGNLLVGTTTDNGVDKLQVNGSINCNNKIVYQNNIIGTFTGDAWYDTGITTDTLGYNILDTFAITIYEDSYGTGNGNWHMLYKFIVGSAMSPSNNMSTFDIPTLSTVGHARHGGIVSLRWQLVSKDLPAAKIQFKVTYTSAFNNSAGKSLRIYVTKLI